MRRAEIMGTEGLVSTPKPVLPGSSSTASTISAMPSAPKSLGSDPLASRLSGLIGGNEKITVDGASSDSSSESEAPESVSNSKPTDAKTTQTDEMDAKTTQTDAIEP